MNAAELLDALERERYGDPGTREREAWTRAGRAPRRVIRPPADPVFGAGVVDLAGPARLRALVAELDPDSPAAAAS